MVRDYTVANQERWMEAVIERQIGKTTYLCQTKFGKRWKRHLNQIIRGTENQSRSSQPRDDDYSYVKLKESLVRVHPVPVRVPAEAPINREPCSSFSDLNNSHDELSNGDSIFTGSGPQISPYFRRNQ